MFETALVMPVYLLFIFVLLEFGHAMMVNNTIRSACRDGARIGTVEGTTTEMVQQRFKEVCSPGHFVKIRNLPGGPSKQSISNSLKIYKKDLSEYKNNIVQRENLIDERKNNLINFYKNHS